MFKRTSVLFFAMLAFAAPARAQSDTARSGER